MTWRDFLVKCPSLFAYSGTWWDDIDFQLDRTWLPVLLDRCNFGSWFLPLQYIPNVLGFAMIFNNKILCYLSPKKKKKKHVEWEGFKLLLYVISFWTLADSESTGSALEVIKGEWGRTLTSRQKRKVHQMNLKYFTATGTVSGTDMALNETLPLIPISSSFPFVLHWYNPRYNN